MNSDSDLIRGFVAAWRRGDAETARRTKQAAWVKHREHPMCETTYRTVKTIFDIESTIPLGQPPAEEKPCPN